ncbi:MmcQ/YjbR family DNA-binding protein [Bergeriella denitrificans]|uniref:Uncharacterized protein conserved in bacteria n=1 Tax=Bergeriella denitrificans TaxID=494 RepID=A0A378UFK5_BERDE|nr:MmcQ/YjbR family DNA-binding protein [Bergeriella denitrificans]STZ76188.1 Uncharacterized protein conserved in bacteria [Bergeriella denitrificans]
MNKEKLAARIRQRYGVQADYPWAKYPDYAVYRHGHNRKWFALLMSVPSEKLGLAGRSGKIDIANFKVRPEYIGAWRSQPGILPAYHMNKAHWVSAVLADCDEAALLSLLADSFALTEK